MSTRREFVAYVAGGIGATLLGSDPFAGFGAGPTCGPRIETGLADELQRLGLTRGPWYSSSLHRVGTQWSDNCVQSKQVAKPRVGFRWERGDNNTSAWIPQGITGLRRN